MKMAAVNCGFCLTLALIPPDKHQDDPDANDRFLLISEAYNVLSDEGEKVMMPRKERIHAAISK